MATADVINVDLPEEEANLDVEMNEQDGAERDAIEAGAAIDENVNADGAAEDALRTTFTDYLKSPIVQLECGSGDSQAILYAHQLLLEQSPHLRERIAEISTTDSPRKLDLLDQDLSTVSSFLEYLYRKDYFPALTQPHQLEDDPSMPSSDDAGTALLRHARVYTLAKQFGIEPLAVLAHKKIHLTQSSAKGELSYARYIYGHTSSADSTIRKPVANFWAMRSHVLRHAAETEFRDMCLEFPQFGYDVLQIVLDSQEKKMNRESGVGSSQGGPAGRKRARVSQA